MTASANVDLVRSIYAAWERGDWFSSAEWPHPEIEFAFVGGPEPGSGVGVAGMAAAMRDWLNAWDEWRAEAVEYRELDAERVLVVARTFGRGKTSGLDVERLSDKGANLFHVRDGKVTRLISYWDLELALADLGLASEAGAAEAPG